MAKIKHDSLIEALLCIQEEISNPKNTAVGYYQNGFCPLPELLDMVKPILNKHGILMVQKVGSNEHGTACIQTILSHVSGDKVESGWLPLNPKTDKDPQKLGSAITYLRRYQISSILNIASQDDDDGNLASGKQTQQPNSTSKEKSEPKKKPKSASLKTTQDNTKKVPKSATKNIKPSPSEIEDAIKSEDSKPEETNELLLTLKKEQPKLYDKLAEKFKTINIKRDIQIKESHIKQACQELLGEGTFTPDDVGIVKELLDI